MSHSLEIEIKYRPAKSPEGVEAWLLPCMLIPTPTAPKHVPHPLGTVVQTFATLEEALARVHQAGYTGVCQGRSYPPKARQATAPTAKPRQETLQLQQALELALPVLLQRLHDKEPACLAQALQTLSHYPSQSLDEKVLLQVVQACYHDAPDVREGSLAALQRWFATDTNRLTLLLSQQLSKAQAHPVQSESQRQRLGCLTVLQTLASHGHRHSLVPFMHLLLHALEDDYWLNRTTAMATVAALIQQDDTPN